MNRRHFAVKFPIFVSEKFGLFPWGKSAAPEIQITECQTECAVYSFQNLSHVFTLKMLALSTKTFLSICNFKKLKDYIIKFPAKIFLLLKKLISCHLVTKFRNLAMKFQWRIQDFPDRESTSEAGVVTYYLAFFLRENERNWTGNGGRL